MKNIMSKNISILAYILSGIFTAILFTGWLIKQNEILSMTQFIVLSGATYILGALFPRLMSPIRCLVDYIIWKLHGYKQSIFSFLFFIKTEQGVSLTSNLYLIDDLILPNNYISELKRSNFNQEKLIRCRKIEIEIELLMTFIYFMIGFLLFKFSEKPFYIIPLFGFLVNLININIDINLFKGRFTKLRNSKYFEYYILRQKLLNNIDYTDSVNWFLELEKDNFDNNEIIFDRMAIWDRIILSCSINKYELPYEADYIIQTKYLKVAWRIYITYEILNMFILYLSYTIINGKENQKKIAVNILKIWQSSDIGSTLWMKLNKIINFFDNRKGTLAIKSFKCGLFYSEFPNINCDLLKLHKYLNYHLNTQ